MQLVETFFKDNTKKLNVANIATSNDSFLPRSFLEGKFKLLWITLQQMLSQSFD